MLVWRKRFDEVCDKSAKYEFGYLIYTLIEKFSKVSNFNLEVRLQSAVVTQSIRWQDIDSFLPHYSK